MKASIAGRWRVFMLGRWLAVGACFLVAGSIPTVIAGGLESIQLSSFYQPESIQIVSSNRPWSLPLAWNSATNGGQVSAMLNLGTNARTAIERNGFVVVPFGPATNIIEPYAILRQLGVPLFVTSDTLLHLYHVQFDEILKSIETNEFFPKLVTMTTTLLDESLRQETSFTGDLREAATRNAAFLTVAARLLARSPPVPQDVEALAEGELGLIAEHAGFSPSPIFKYQEDYSQYVPRGHYTRSEALKQYFKAMMWYGRLSFLLKGSDNFGPAGEALVSRQDAKIQTLQALLLTQALDRLAADGQPIADAWNRIYAVTAFFVGLADDLTPYDYQEAITRVFGPGATSEDFSDDQKLFDLKRQLAVLGSPQIYGGTGNCQVPPDATQEDLDRVLDKTKGMRVMGQRFIPDAFMFQQLVLPVIGPFIGTGTPFTMEFTQAGPRRCFPRGLDVMAVLGSQLALNLLDQAGDTAYLNYDTSLNELSVEFASFGEGEWHRNLYWAWLYTLKPLVAPCDSRNPSFMQTPAWQAKQLNTALASWTELRHDTILYAKQSYTAVVTGIPNSPDAGYVEPVPEFYERLLSLTRMTRTGLDGLQVLNEVQRTRLLALENILLQLRDIGIAELESRPLSEPQRGFIAAFDLALTPLTNGIADGLDTSTTLVADVHTDGNTAQVLEEGAGFANLILVAYPAPNGARVLGAGPVLSYYEFKWPMSDRLTDERWADLLTSGQQPASPTWTRLFAEPVTLPPEDRNGDRLADSWERAYWPGITSMNDPSADPDGDGLTNEQEALAGTDPTNPASALRLVAAHGPSGEVRLQWQSIAGKMYRVRCSENLTDWRLLGAPVIASGETTVFSDLSPMTTASRFYRLEVLP